MKLNKEAKKLAEDLGLSDIDAYMMQFKSQLLIACANAINESKLTHQEIASLLQTSRTRVTRMANLGEVNVSVEMLIKTLTFLRGGEVVKLEKVA